MTSGSSEFPLVWIFVLHFQGSEHTRACLASLRELNYANKKVLLVDNGSPDKSGAAIAADFPEVVFLQSPENLGFAGGSNYGIKYCLEQGAEWIWLLNNDTRMQKDSLNILVQHALANNKAGALAAMTFDSVDTTLISSGVGKIDFLRAKTFLKSNLPQENCVSSEWVSGCNLLLRAKALQTVSGFDEEYFLYFEDTDLCLRLRQSGWQTCLVPKARLEHVGGASTEGKLNTWRSYYYTRNRLLFFCKHTPFYLLPITLFSIFAHLLRHCLVLPFRGEKGRKQLAAELLGTRDFLQHKLGKATCLD